MSDEKTAPVRPRRDSDKESGPIGENEARFDYSGKRKEFRARMGRGFLFGAIFVGSGVASALGFYGVATVTKDDVKAAVSEAVKEAAPAPELVNKVAEDVSKMGDAMSSLAADVKVSISRSDSQQKQLDQNSSDIRELQKTIPTVREMDDMRQQLRDTKKEVDDLKADVRTLKDRK